MHVCFSLQNRLPTLPETFRNKSHLKQWPESPPANLPVSLGHGADSLPIMRGRSANYTEPLDVFQPPKNLYGGRSPPYGRMIRRSFFQHYKKHPGTLLLSQNSPWLTSGWSASSKSDGPHLEPDGPLLPSWTVRVCLFNTHAFTHK
jgi:hypothetical protein